MSLREVLSALARIVYPLGLIAPSVITPKILLQNFWRLGISWDQEVPQEYIPIIEKWTRQCGHDKNVKLPRFVGQIDRRTDIQLHVFPDASQCAMAACIYIQAHKQSSNQTISTKIERHSFLDG